MTAVTPASTEGFVHLRVHSEFSVADGLMKVGALADAARRLNMPAVALTDRSNLFGLVKFYQACLSAGVKPLVGSDLVYQTDEGGRFRIAVLAMNSQGYRNLLALVSAAYLDTDERGVLSAGQIFARQEGLLVLSGGRQGEVGQALAKGDLPGAQRIAALWEERFPERFYLELVRTGRGGEDAYIDGAVRLAAELELPVVATNDVCFLAADDFEAHETRVCIYDGRTLDDPRRERSYSSDQYLRTPAEMTALFSDLPEAIENTVHLSRVLNSEPYWHSLLHGGQDTT